MASRPTSPSESSRPAPSSPLLATLAAWWQEGVALARRAPLLAAVVGMAVLGFAISVYLTTVHYAGVRLVCSTGGIVNCAAVTSSAYSVIPGTQLPITIPGMLWFAVSGAMAVVALVALRRGESEPARLRLAHAIWGGLGLVFVFYLVFAELVKLRSICEWCTAVHLLTLFTFFIALYRLQLQMSGEEAQAFVAPARPASKNASGYRANGSGSREVSGSRGQGAGKSANRMASASASGQRATGQRSASRSTSRSAGAGTARSSSSRRKR